MGLIMVLSVRHTASTSGQTHCKFLARLIAKTHERLIDYFQALNNMAKHKAITRGGGVTRAMETI